MSRQDLLAHYADALRLMHIESARVDALLPGPGRPCLKTLMPSLQMRNRGTLCGYLYELKRDGIKFDILNFEVVGAFLLGAGIECVVKQEQSVRPV